VDEFLASTDVVDWVHPDVVALAKALAGGPDQTSITARCFRFVRDEIRHSIDRGDQTVTCSASEVLRHRTGLCYAKSHLLAALLRANGVPAGFAYQRLSIDEVGPPFCLHGLNAVLLPGLGWHFVDARGDRQGISTAFDPPRISLAFQPQLVGETTFNQIWADPLKVVVDSLEDASSIDELRSRLPDWTDETM
jgi:transglutaminase-like putative cysteine protease